MLLAWMRKLFDRSPDPLGRRGEKLAARWLRKRGFRILERNFCLGDDEADLIALDPDGKTIVIVEVKTRLNAATAPESAINSRKQFRVARLAARLQKSPAYRDHPFRLDAVAVEIPAQGQPQIRHVPGAFASPW